MWTCACSLFTTLPTATSSLLVGFATYDRRGFSRSLMLESDRRIEATRLAPPTDGREGRAPLCGKIGMEEADTAEGVGEMATRLLGDDLRGRGVEGVGGT